MRTITRQRFIDENLDFTEIVESEDGEIKRVRYVVTDNDGVVYDGVVSDDGSFNDGYAIWENVDVCERFDRWPGDPQPIAHKYIGRWYSESLYFNPTTE